MYLNDRQIDLIRRKIKDDLRGKKIKIAYTVSYRRKKGFAGQSSSDEGLRINDPLCQVFSLAKFQGIFQTLAICLAVGFS